MQSTDLYYLMNLLPSKRNSYRMTEYIIFTFYLFLMKNNNQMANLKKKHEILIHMSFLFSQFGS